MHCDSFSASAESNRHNSTFVACSENSVKFTPPPSRVAPSGDGRPGQTRRAVTSLRPRGELLHDSQPLRLQRTHAAAGHEPHAFVLRTAVDDVDAVEGGRVMECGAG